MQQELPESIANRYRVLGLFGAGGIGVVYQAFDPVLDKKVAVKVLLHLSDDLKVRFHQEAKAAGKLKHRNIISVLDFGLTKEQQPYMVMECVDGKTLSSALSGGGGMALADAVGIFLQICDGLEHAHKNGVVHRDIKPGNIMLTDVGGDEPRAIIVDFGLAKLWSTDQSMTASGKMMGSPFYISPEQIAAGEVDARTDIYSLGCLMFEVLTGRAPFRGESIQETMAMHLNSPIPTLASVSGDTYEPELENIVSRCLAKKKEDRFGSIAELRAALIEFCSKSDDIDSDAVLASAPVLPVMRAMSGVKVLNRKIVLLAVAWASLIVCLVIRISTPQAAQESMDSFDKIVKREDRQDEIIGDYRSFGDYAMMKGTGGAEAMRVAMNRKNIKRDNRVRVDAALSDPFATKVDLRATYLDRKDLVKLGKFSNLEVLYWARALKDSKESFEPLTALRKLRTLSLRDSEINDDNLKSIGKLSSLEELDLNECYGFSNESLHYLTNNKNLKNLNLEGYMGLDDEGIKNISEIKSLRILNIDRTYDYHGSAFALLANLKNLNYLVMTFQGATPAEAKKRYEVLNRITSLNSLGLRDVDFANLGILAAHPALNSIAMRASELNAADVSALSKLNIKTLQLLAGSLDEKALRVLANSKIETIVFNNCRLDSKGLLQFRKAKQFKTLNFYHCDVDLKVVKLLRDELTGCQFVVRQAPEE